MSAIQGAAVLLCLLAAVGCNRSEHYYIQRGNRLLQAGKPADAVIQYRKAVQRNSKSGEAYYRLGLAQLRQGSAVEALNALNRAVQLSPGNEDAAARLADLNLAAYLSDPRRSKVFYDRVAALSNGLIERNASSVEGLRLKGALALVDRKPQEAIAYYRRADQLHPLQLDVVEGLTQALFLSNRFEEGERVARAYLERDKKAPSIYDLLYLRYLSAKRPEEAEKILLAKAANNPREVSYRLQVAQFYLNANKPAQMAATIQYVLDRPQEFPQGRLQVGDFYSSVGDQDQALRQFQLGAATNSKDKTIYQKRVAGLLANQGQREEALKMVNQILVEQPKDSEALSAQATLLIDGGNHEDIARATNELTTLVNENRDDARLHFQLGRAYLASGKWTEGRAEFLESAKMQADYLLPRLALAEMGMSNRNPQEALTMSEQILALNPNQPRARLLHGAALTSLGRQTEARAELKQLLKEFPQSPEVQMQLGIVAVSEKKYREAEQVFGKSQQRGASDPLAAVGLAETYSAQKQYDRAIQLLQGELKKSPGSPTIGRLLAYTAARAGNYNVAIGAYQSLLEGNPKQPELYLSLAEAYFAKQDYEHSIQALNSAKNLAPKDGRVDMLLAAALRESGRAAEAKPYLEHVLEAQPNNPVALNNMAFYMAENGGNLDKALELAQRAVRQSPGEPSFSDTLGWIYTKKNMHIAAVQIFTNLLKKQPNDPTIRYHLGVALMGKGDHEGARIELQTALSKAPAKDEEQKIRALLAKLD